MNEKTINSLAHTRRRCKQNLIFISKCGKKSANSIEKQIYLKACKATPCFNEITKDGTEGHGWQRNILPKTHGACSFR